LNDHCGGFPGFLRKDVPELKDIRHKGDIDLQRSQEFWLLEHLAKVKFLHGIFLENTYHG